jgi:hypothetical protein
LYFFSKALKTYQAICCLWTTGFEQDASVLSRTVFEIVLQCEWLRVNPMEHAVRFQEHAATLHYAAYLRIDKIAQSGRMPDVVAMRDRLQAAPAFATWQAQHNAFATKYGYGPNKVPHNWWGDTLHDVVKALHDAGVNTDYLAEEYYYAYTIESTLVHSSAMCYLDYVERDNEGLQLHYHPESPANASVMIHATRRVLRIAAIVSHAWALPFDAQIADDLAVIEEMANPDAGPVP